MLFVTLHVFSLGLMQFSFGLINLCGPLHFQIVPEMDKDVPNEKPEESSGKSASPSDIGPHINFTLIFHFDRFSF